MTTPDKKSKPNVPHVANQVTAAWVQLEAAHRLSKLAGTLAVQDKAFADAMEEVQRLHAFIGSPEHILGNPDTKHGEIAEQLYVSVARARDLVYGRTPSATFAGTTRNGPIDYFDGGVGIQAKYYNGPSNTLQGVLDHALANPDLASSGGKYHIPSDQYFQLKQLQETGRIDGFSDRSAASINRMIATLDKQTGRPIDVLIEPGEGTYAEVQQGRIDETLDNRQSRLAEENEQIEGVIRDEHRPSVAGLGKATAIGVATSAGIGLTQAMYVKYREGKNPFRGGFTAADWRDVGVTTTMAGGSGGVAAGSIYLLTNSVRVSAPAAGAFVSGLMGIGSLVHQYSLGTIDGEQFVDMSMMVSSDAAIVGITSLAGQALIPVPMLGAFIGASAGRFVASAIRDSLGAAESELLAQLDASVEFALNQVDDAFQTYAEQLDDYFGNLERLAMTAFNPDLNVQLRLQASIEYAEAVGVPDSAILHSIGETDKYMRS